MSKKNAKPTKEEKFRKAIIDFEASNKGVESYMEFMAIVWHVLSPGDGISWEEVRGILEDILNKG